jgi:hypothetical protein
MNKYIIKIEEYLKLLAKIPHDKLLHFFYGFLLFNFLSIFFTFVTSLIILIVAAIAKEVYDYYVPGHESSMADIYYGIAPGVVQTILTFL